MAAFSASSFAAAAAVANWNFNNAQAGARSAHLHFEVPTISHFAHAQLQKGSAAPARPR
jgi:hypothetical protein